MRNNQSSLREHRSCPVQILKGTGSVCHRTFGLLIPETHGCTADGKDELSLHIPTPVCDRVQLKRGLPSFDDKLVQEVIRMILEAIYEGYFEYSSHGFRPDKSCHTALTHIQNSFTGTKWFIEGDIKGFFDNINHEVLINTLKERIADARFIRLIRKFLNAGYMEDRKFHKTYSGAPQGGIISPIPANIYLDRFDKYMSEYSQTFSKGKRRRENPEAVRLSGRKYTLCSVSL
jgi:retron-type reverse transcriptase